MKNIIIFTILALTITLFACKKDDAGAPAKLAINGVMSLDGSRAASDKAHLNWIAKYVWEVSSTGFRRGFNNNPIDHEYAQRDTINGRLFFFGNDAIGGINAGEDGLGVFLSKANNVVFTVLTDSDGNISGDWSETDYKFMKRPGATMNDDTVAYIPNAIMNKTRREVKAALDAGDNQRCYELFDKAIVFIPITGAEYRELEKQGLN